MFIGYIQMGCLFIQGARASAGLGSGGRPEPVPLGMTVVHVILPLQVTCILPKDKDLNKGEELFYQFVYSVLGVFLKIWHEKTIFHWRNVWKLLVWDFKFYVIVLKLYN